MCRGAAKLVSAGLPNSARHFAPKCLGDHTVNTQVLPLVAEPPKSLDVVSAPQKALTGGRLGQPAYGAQNPLAVARVESDRQRQDAPVDEVADAIAELEAEANGTRKATPAKKPAKAPAAKKAPAPTAHTDCTHAKSGAEGKKARAACRREKAAEAAKAAKA